MDKASAAGRRSHRRLILTLLALALGATLGAAAPQAFAGHRDPPLEMLPSITLRVSSTYPHRREVIKVAGEVMPVASVGDLVTIALDRKSRKGAWIEVSGPRVQVQFDAPASWSGTWDTRQDSVGTKYARVGTLANWQGRVLFEHPTVNLTGHYVDYEMTWAGGSSKYDGISYDGVGEASSLYEYVGYPTKAAGAPADIGGIRRYFADSTDGIGIDSYTGLSNHRTAGVLTVTYLAGSPPTVTKDPVPMIDSDSMWNAGDPGPRPMLRVDGRMTEKLTRPGTLANGPGETVTKVSDWDLAPSEAIKTPLQREGYYTGGTTAVKAGSYRIRAEIGGIHSSWIALTVR